MGPFGLVVAGPHGAKALGARVVGAGEDERPAAGGWRFAGEERMVGSVDKGHAIDVMDVAMFPVAVMNVVFWHSGLGPVEDRRFVHVVPYEGV